LPVPGCVGSRSSLRHSCASAMIAAGAPVTEVQHHLGHANPSITLAVYSHWFRNVDRGGAVDRLAAAVLGLPFTLPRKKPAECAESGHPDKRDSDAGLGKSLKNGLFIKDLVNIVGG